MKKRTALYDHAARNLKTKADLSSLADRKLKLAEGTIQQLREDGDLLREQAFAQRQAASNARAAARLERGRADRIERKWIGVIAALHAFADELHDDWDDDPQFLE